MAGATRRVIALLGTPIVLDEDEAAEAITPGHLVEYSGGNLIKHATAAGKAARNFALERDEMGKDIDTAYAIGDQVKVGAFHQGQRVLVWIASGQNITKGNYLESAGDGTLRAMGSGVPLAQAVENNNNAAGPGDSRLRVQIV
jgi:hypothetical protein